LKRWGFVKLSRYGLALTPEDRILSTQPSVLDDGLGGRIVGWQDDDLAVAQLKPWREAPAPRAVAPSALHPSTPVPVPASAPPAALSTPPLQSVAPVVAAPPVEEEDWEWKISLARARAAAEETEEAARDLSALAPAPAPVRPLATVQAPSHAPAPRATTRRPTAAPVLATRPVAMVRPAARSQTTRLAVQPAPPEAAPEPRPALSPAEVASKVRPVVGSKPAAGAPAPAPTRSPSRPSPSPRDGKVKARAVIVHDNDHGEPAGELLQVQTSEPSAAARSARPLAHTVPVAQEATQVSLTPRRFANGTSPVTSTSRGIPAVRPSGAPVDELTATEISLAEHTATDLMLGEYTTPNLPPLERTRPGVALPTFRGRAVR